MSGAVHLTPAIVLGGVRYGETSRIVRLLTREHGLVSALAKGAFRPRSRFGAALALLSEGEAHLLWARSSDLHTLAAFDLRTPHLTLATDLDRFQAAAALAELLGKAVPPGPNPPLYTLVTGAVALLAVVPREGLAETAVHLVWRVVGALGVAPALAQCVRDGNPIGEAGTLSLAEGGMLCRKCSGEGVQLGTDDLAALRAFLAPGELPHDLDSRHLAAHRRLLLRWVQRHLVDGPLPALEGWVRPFHLDSPGPGSASSG